MVVLAATQARGQGDPDRAGIEQWILEQRGEFDFDPTFPGKPIVAVRLDRTRGIDPGFVPDSLSDADMKRLNALTDLRSLTLEYRPAISDAGLRYVAGIESLVELNLSRTSLKGFGLGYLAGLPKLRMLDLSRCAWLTDDSAVYLEDLKQITCLHLDATGEGWASSDIWRRNIQVSQDTVYWKQHSDSALDPLRGGISDVGLTHVAKLDQLVELSVAMTRISDAGVQQLVKLHQLERLDLSCTAITDEAFKHVAKLNGLKALKLNFVSVSDEGLKQISKLPALEELELRGSNISAHGIRLLSEMQSLRKLDLSTTRMNENTVEALKVFKNLRELDISGFRHAFSSLVDFERANPNMDLKQVLLASGLGKVNRQNQLVQLNLRGQQLEREDDLAWLQQFEHLESLDCAESNLNDAGIRYLKEFTKLKYLNVVGSLVTDDGLQQLGGLTNLDNFPIRESELSFAAATDLLVHRQGRLLQEALRVMGILVPPSRSPQAETEFLDLRNVRLTESDLATIRLYDPTRMLFLPVMEISDQGLAYLGDLHSLERLWIAGCHITRQGLMELASVPNLKELFLTDCELESDALTSVGGSLPRLRVLNLSGSMRNEAQFESLAEVNSLQMLIIDNEAFSDTTLCSWQANHPGVEVFQTQRLALSAVRDHDRRLHRLPHGSLQLKEMGAVRTRVDENELVEIYGDVFFELAETILISDENREAAIAALPRLDTIETVSANNVRNVTGIVPALGQLPELRQISFYGSSIRDNDLAGLDELHQLESLDLQRTQVTDAALIHLRSLSNLKTLRLGGYGTEIKDPGIQYLAELSNLVELSLNRTSITDAALVHLRGLNKLERLSLREVLIDQGLVHIANHKTLTQLDLSATFLSDTTVGFFSRFPEMLSVSVDNTMLTEKGVRQLQSLVPARAFREPRLMSASTHAAMVPLAKMRVRCYRDSKAQVFMLDLRELDSVESALPSVRQLSETLRDIRLGRHANDLLVSNLSKFANIESLDLSDGSVTAAGLLRLAEVKTLTTLKLRRYRLSQADLEAIGQMKQLKSLNLYGCQLPKNGLDPLGELSNLHQLYLTSSSLRDADLKVICTLPSLEHLALGKTNVSSSGLTCLENTPLLRTLYLADDIFDNDPSALKQLQALLPECSIRLGE